MSDAALEQAFEAEEAAAREGRRAAFLAARQAAAEQQARDTQRAEQRTQAIARRVELRAEHAERVAGLRERFEGFGRLYEALNDLVALVDDDVQRDFTLCAEYAELGAIAGEIDALAPLDVDTIRAAVGLDLARKWDDADAPLHLWLATATAPNWNDGTATAQRARAAGQLLEQLNGEANHE